ncbi:MAG: ferrous iron transport protein A [Chloroflexaceae bacterium]|nr:ferrous iron transport protein A [Chloroflexaceae bacterium]
MQQVVPREVADGSEQPQQSLTDLRPGACGRVTHIAAACQGSERRRLMDLGIVPGTLITVEMRSPAGNPTAYRVRGALIALRQEQARFVGVVALQEGAYNE